MSKDLFGNEMAERIADFSTGRTKMLGPKGGMHYTPKKGYAAKPGTGPQGETCATCVHHARVEMAKVYHKCNLMRPKWTGGAGTDILTKSPACSKFEKDTK